MKRIAALLALAAALLAGCSTPIGVLRVTTQETQRAMTSNALTDRKPSEWSRQVLHRASLFEKHRTDPEGALDELYKFLLQRPTPDALFALSELSFLYAERFQRRDHFLAAAVFGYAFLLPEHERAAVSPLDPRARLALDLYNEALAQALVTADRTQVRLDTSVHRLPFGQLSVSFDPAQLLWAGFRLKNFVATSQFKVRGLRNRYRQAGAGAPLVAELDAGSAEPAALAARRRIPATAKVPVTAFLRIESPLRGVLEGNLHAQLELYTRDRTESLKVGGREVPLEFESTASIAYQLEGAAVWNTEIAGFRVAEAPALGNGLMLLQPRRPGRIPVVFVHGTASSPARWAEMYNELSNDEVLRDRYEFWLFQYATGQPVLYSAALLRRDLRAVVDEVDAKREDPALRRMVVIGHSQGGLLAKLMAVRSGTRFWDNVTRVPFEEFDAPAETKALFREALFFEPVPELERVVFIATPHRGSFLAGGVVQELVRRFITLPSRLVDNANAIRNLPAFAESGIAQLPTSVDNMTPDTRFIRTLESLPFGPRIKINSIVPVIGAGPPDDLDDGVVKYRSAHIDGIESELVVRSGHSAQDRPEAIEEVRRILREHLAGPRQ